MGKRKGQFKELNHGFGLNHSAQGGQMNPVKVEGLFWPRRDDFGSDYIIMSI